MADISSIKLPDGSTYNLKDSTARTVVKQTAKSDNKEYKILTTSSDSPTSGDNAEAAYDAGITINPSTHTLTATNFAGNASTATSASKLQNTSKVGDTNKPVYFTASGVPAAINYTIDKNVPSNAIFTDTTYTFANGINGFTVTPSGGSAQTVTVTPSITNNITGSGTSNYLTKFNGTNTITNGPQLSSAVSSQSQTTKFLREDGTWAAPSYTTNTNTTYTIATGDANGQIKVTPSSGNAYNVNVKGLGSNAFNSTDFLPRNSELLTTNPFAPNILKGPYISKIDNALYAADKRWTVTSTNISGISNLFDGNYDTHNIISNGDTAIITIDFSDEPTGYFPGYPYGYFLISFYYAALPANVSGRVYCNYATHGVGWHDISFSPVSGSGSTNTVYRSDHQGYYQISKMEFTIVGDTTNSYGKTQVCQIELHLDRPDSKRNPFVSKYGPEILYYNLTAPKFIGPLQGNADTATSASKLQNTSKVGDTNKPVYFTANGVPAEISYTVDKSVPSTAVFTDTTYTFADGTAGNFTVTPSGGSAQTISIGKPATAGTADSAKKLASIILPSGDEGAFKFLEIPMQYVSQQTMVLSIDSNFSSSCGLLRIHTKRISNEVFQEIGWIASGKSHPTVRWKYSDNKWNLYLIKSSLETISFHIISATNDNSYRWKGDSVTAEDFLAATEADEYVDLQAASAVEDANGDQIDTTYLKKTETAPSSYTLFPTKVYSDSLAVGWYKFAEVNITDTTGRAKITFKHGLSNANYDFIGEIFVYKTNSTTMNCTMQIPYSVSGKITYFRYNIDSANTVSFYVYKHDAYGNPVFTFITSEDINGNYLDPSTYMLDSLVAETPPATALKPIYSAINRWVYNVPVSPGTNQQILSYSLGMITSASVLAKIEFANPEYIKSDCSWETTDGANPNDNGTITITGTCTAATTANLLILNVLPD